MLLCLASLLTTLKENFGAPIDCIVDKDLPKSVFEVEKVFLFRNFSLPYAWHFRPTAGSMAPSHYPPRYACCHQAKIFVGNICQISVNSCVSIFSHFSSRESRGEILRILELDHIPGCKRIKLLSWNIWCNKTILRSFFH